MTDIWAVARLAASGSAEMYFIMSKILVVKGRKNEASALQTSVLNLESRRERPKGTR